VQPSACQAKRLDSHSKIAFAAASITVRGDAPAASKNDAHE
jgi:hypothetical protein